MPYLPAIYPKDLMNLLLKQGFYAARKKGSHVRLIHTDGRSTTIALHNKPLYKGTLFAILRQVKLTQQELKELL